MLARQAFYHLNHAPSPSDFFPPKAQIHENKENKETKASTKFWNFKS
jgi:hypothetical protein